MPDLSPTARSFLEFLGIPRRVPLADPTRGLAEELITMYEQREQVVIMAVEEMARLRIHHDLTGMIKARVEAVQKAMRHGPQDAGPSVLKKAAEALQNIYASLLATLPPPGRNYFARLAGVQLLHAKLKATVVKREADEIAAAIARAREEAAGGQPGKAIELLDAAADACQAAERLLLDYLKAVGSAVIASTVARPHMSELDIQLAVAALGEAAGQAKLGNRDAARALVDTVEPHCQKAVKAAESTDYRAVSELARGLKQHPASAEFGKFMAELMRRLGLIREEAAERQSSTEEEAEEEEDDEDEDQDDDSSFTRTIEKFRNDAGVLLALMEKHLACAKLGKAAEDAVAALGRFDPQGVNTGLQRLLAGFAHGLGLAWQQAAAHDYDRAQAIFKQVMLECPAKLQAACSDRLRAMEEQVRAAPKTDLFNHDTKVMERLLAAAKTQAASGRYDRASALLTWVQKKARALQELSGQVETINNAMRRVKHQMGHDLHGALAGARAFSNALKARVGSADFKRPLQMIAGLLEQADKAIASDPVKTGALLQQLIDACWRTAVAAESLAAFKKRYAEEIQATHASIEGDPAVDPVSLMKLRKILDKAQVAATEDLHFAVASDLLDEAVVVMASMLARQPIPT